MKLLLFLLLSLPAVAQTRDSGVVIVFSPPSGACASKSAMRYYSPAGTYWGCSLASFAALMGTWTQIGSSSSGTVTSVGLSSNLGTVTGSPVTTAGTLTLTGTSAAIISLFTGCSGTQYLGADGACHTPLSGTVTSVSWTGGIVSVANPTTTPAFTIAGTSGGIPYFSSSSTWASSAALTVNLPVIGGGAGSAPTVGTRSGNTTSFATTSGSLPTGDCAIFDANGNVVDGGFGCSGSTAPGLKSGAAFTPVNTATGSNSNWQNFSSLNKISGAALYQYPTSWKVRMRFTAGSPVIGAMKILTTLTGSATVTATTTVTISGVSNPTLTTPGLVDTDAISLALDNTHDYWFVIFFTNTAANASVAVAAASSQVPSGAQSIVAMSNGIASGDQTGVATIPTITGTNAPYLVVAGILP